MPMIHYWFLLGASNFYQQVLLLVAFSSCLILHIYHDLLLPLFSCFLFPYFFLQFKFLKLLNFSYIFFLSQKLPSYFQILLKLCFFLFALAKWILVIIWFIQSHWLSCRIIIYPSHNYLVFSISFLINLQARAAPFLSLDFEFHYRLQWFTNSLILFLTPLYSVCLINLYQNSSAQLLDLFIRLC